LILHFKFCFQKNPFNKKILMNLNNTNNNQLKRILRSVIWCFEPYNIFEKFYYIVDRYTQSSLGLRIST
jgi:hypothetical protein